jgi:Ca2+/Na+ antiporter
MKEIFKSIYLSIIFTGILFFIMFYFKLNAINYHLSVIIIFLVLFILFLVYFKKTNKNKTIELPIEEKESSLIDDKSLLKPVDETKIVPFKNKEEKKEVSKPSKNYENIFRNINREINRKK